MTGNVTGDTKTPPQMFLTPAGMWRGQKWYRAYNYKSLFYSGITVSEQRLNFLLYTL